MILVLICSAFIAFLFIYNTEHSWTSWWEYPFIGAFGAILGFLLGLIITTPIPMETHIEQSIVRIETLSDNSATRGRFFLGSGNVDGNMVYVFYVKEGNDIFSMVQISHEKAKIKYTTSKPIVNIYKITETKGALINYMAIDWDLGDQTYLIEVPKGSIQNNYNLDAQ